MPPLHRGRGTRPSRHRCGMRTAGGMNAAPTGASRPPVVPVGRSPPFARLLGARAPGATAAPLAADLEPARAGLLAVLRVRDDDLEHPVVEARARLIRLRALG